MPLNPWMRNQHLAFPVTSTNVALLVTEKHTLDHSQSISTMMCSLAKTDHAYNSANALLAVFWWTSSRRNVFRFPIATFRQPASTTVFFPINTHRDLAREIAVYQNSRVQIIRAPGYSSTSTITQGHSDP